MWRSVRRTCTSPLIETPPVLSSGHLWGLLATVITWAVIDQGEDPAGCCTRLSSNAAVGTESRTCGRDPVSDQGRLSTGGPYEGQTDPLRSAFTLGLGSPGREIEDALASPVLRTRLLSYPDEVLIAAARRARHCVKPPYRITVEAWLDACEEVAPKSRLAEPRADVAVEVTNRARKARKPSSTLVRAASGDPKPVAKVTAIRPDDRARLAERRGRAPGRLREDPTRRPPGTARRWVLELQDVKRPVPVDVDVAVADRWVELVTDWRLRLPRTSSSSNVGRPWQGGRGG